MDAGTETDQSVCVVTHPLSTTSEAAVNGLLEVVSAAASSVSLITANLPEDSDVWDSYEVCEISSSETGSRSVLQQYDSYGTRYGCAANSDGAMRRSCCSFGAVSYLLPILLSRLVGKRVIVEPRETSPIPSTGSGPTASPDRLAFLLSRSVWLLERAGYLAADAILLLSPSMADDPVWRLRNISTKSTNTAHGRSTSSGLLQRHRSPTGIERSATSAASTRRRASTC